MSSGSNCISGTLTVPGSGDCVIDFGKTINKYLYLIEATAETKTAIMNSGRSNNVGFALIGVFPKPSISSAEADYTATYFRANPSTSATSYSSTTNNPNLTSSSMTLLHAALNTNNTNVVYNGYTYNYYIFPIE